MIPKIQLSDYDYTLPEERIAKFPLENRADSKLLLFKQKQISHHRFYEIPDLLPADSLLIYNNTKVIPARLIFQRESGAKIEIFLLQPVEPTRVIPEIMISKVPVVWEAMIGNSKKWKDGEVLQGRIQLKEKEVILKADLISRSERLVRFSWDDPEVSFVDLVENSGEVPLPPYLNRKPVEADKQRYQTVYSEKEGAVAAPTAGLHFTEEIFEKLEQKGIQKSHVTLHVSAGTFQPIKAEEITDHPMHSEQILVDRVLIQKVLDHTDSIVAVGTTSLRTLESLYWYGVMLLEGLGSDFTIEKLFPYQNYSDWSLHQSFTAVLEHMDATQKDVLMGSTEIFIFPGYSFKVIKGLITNFHQPGSTLILLIAAMLGEQWKELYEEALGKDYRFLSYGDSSLLWMD